MDLIIYHANCTDGWCAAYVAQKKYPGVKLIGAQYSTALPLDAVAGQDVLVVDFSWKAREDNIRLSQAAKSFRILDHHKSCEAILEGLDFATVDLSRSGAGLAWDYLFGTRRPWYVDYVEDHDLWKHRLAFSRQVSAYLHLIPNTVEAWDDLSETELHTAARLGKGALMQIESNARRLVTEANPGRGWGHSLGVVNAPTWQASEVGEIISKTYDVAVIWWERKDGIVTFSLRSNDKGNVDVSKIATLMGGGGHKHAAGFEVPDLSEAYLLLRSILELPSGEPYEF
jgi:uncharacterized protein